MKLKKESLMIIFLFLLFLFALWAKEKPISPNIKCLSCQHIKSASKTKLRINEEYFFASAQAALKGTDCHQAIL
jgi:hypothetical protein